MVAVHIRIYASACAVRFSITCINNMSLCLINTAKHWTSFIMVVIFVGKVWLIIRTYIHVTILCCRNTDLFFPYMSQSCLILIHCICTPHCSSLDLKIYLFIDILSLWKYSKNDTVMCLVCTWTKTLRWKLRVTNLHIAKNVLRLSHNTGCRNNDDATSRLTVAS